MSCCPKNRNKSSSKPQQQKGNKGNKKPMNGQRHKSDDSDDAPEPEFLYESSFGERVRRILQNGDVRITSGARSIVLCAEEVREALAQALQPPTHPSQLQKGRNAMQPASHSTQAPVIVDARNSLPLVPSATTDTPPISTSTAATAAVTAGVTAGATATPNAIIHPSTHPSRTSSFSCSCCNLSFSSVQIFRAHVRSPFHAFNLRRQQQDLRPLTEDEYERGKDDEVFVRRLDAGSQGKTEAKNESHVVTTSNASPTTTNASAAALKGTGVSHAMRRAVRGAATSLLSSVLGVAADGSEHSGEEDEGADDRDTSDDESNSDASTCDAGKKGKKKGKGAKKVHWSGKTQRDRPQTTTTTTATARAVGRHHGDANEEEDEEDASDSDNGEDNWVSCTEDESDSDNDPENIFPNSTSEKNLDSENNSDSEENPDASRDSEDDTEAVLGDTTPFLTITSLSEPSLSVCIPKRLLLPARMKIPATIHAAKATLTALAQIHTRTRKLVCFMSAGGKFAGCVVERGVVLRHKTFQNYVVRKKQGGSQAAHDNKGRRAQSVGSQIRRQQVVRFRERTRTLLHEWRSDIISADRIVVFAPGLDWENLRMDDREKEKWGTSGGMFVCRGNAVRVSDVEEEAGRVLKIGVSAEVIAASIGASESEIEVEVEEQEESEKKRGKEQKKGKGKTKNAREEGGKKKGGKGAVEEEEEEEPVRKSADTAVEQENSETSEIWYRLSNPEGVCGGRAWHPFLSSCSIDATHIYLLHPQDPRILRPLGGLRGCTFDESVRAVSELTKARVTEDVREKERKKAEVSDSEGESGSGEEEDAEEEAGKASYDEEEEEEDVEDETIRFYRNSLRTVVVKAMATGMALPLPRSTPSTASNHYTATCHSPASPCDTVDEDAESPVPLELENPYLHGCIVNDAELLSYAREYLATVECENKGERKDDDDDENEGEEEENQSNITHASHSSTSASTSTATSLPPLSAALDARIKRWCASQYRYFTPVCIAARAAALVATHRALTGDSATAGVGTTSGCDHAASRSALGDATGDNAPIDTHIDTDTLLSNTHTLPLTLLLLRASLLAAEVAHTHYYLQKHKLTFSFDPLGRHLTAFGSRLRRVPRQVLRAPVAALLYYSACHEDARAELVLQYRQQSLATVMGVGQGMDSHHGNSRSHTQSGRGSEPSRTHARANVGHGHREQGGSAGDRQVSPVSASVLAAVPPHVTAALAQTTQALSTSSLSPPSLSTPSFSTPSLSFSLTPSALTPALSLTADESVRTSLFAVFLTLITSTLPNDPSSVIPRLSGRTALHVACHEGFPFPFIHALLLAGADPTRKDAFGCVPLELYRGPKRTQESLRDEWRVFALAHPRLADWEGADLDLREKDSQKDAETMRRRAVEAAKKALEADARREKEAARRAQSERDRIVAATRAAREEQEREAKRAKEAAEAARRRDMELRWRASEASVRAAELEHQTRMAALTDSEKRALAYDMRIAAARGQADECAACGLAIISIPFERLSFKYCSMLCLRKHRDQLGE